MFFISLPKDTTVGDTVDCRVNTKPARVTWRDDNHLVIEPDDARTILAINKDAALIHFTCGDAGMERSDYAFDMEESGAGFLVSEKPSRRRSR